MSEPTDEQHPGDAGSPEAVGGFQLLDVPTAEVDAAEAASQPAVDAARSLARALIRTRVGADELALVAKELEELTARLEADADPGPVGVRFNHEGRSWEWGNAAVGQRNVAAAPLECWFVDDGLDVAGRAVLDERHEGPPGLVHGGVSALLLDQVMGKTASAHHTQFTFTGTLTMRYRQPLGMGPVELFGRISRQEGRKVWVEATIGNPGSVAVEAEGIFIKPAWGEAQDAAAAIS